MNENECEGILGGIFNDGVDVDGVGFGNFVVIEYF